MLVLHKSSAISEDLNLPEAEGHRGFILQKNRKSSEMAEDLCVNLLQVLSWQIPKFHVKPGLFATFINMAQDFYSHENKSFTYMKTYNEFF